MLHLPRTALAAAIIDKSPAGEMLRRLLPGIIVLPLVIGWFAHQAEIANYYDSAATLAIFAVSSIVVLAAFSLDDDRRRAARRSRPQRGADRAQRTAGMAEHHASAVSARA